MSDDWKNAKGAATQETIDRLAATGFLRTVPDPTDSNERGLIAERMNVLADEVEVLTSSVMGITVGCARCHNHKYDPIPQRDYYRLSAILQGAYDPYEWKGPKKRELDLATEAERKAVAEQNAPVQAEIKQIQQQIREAAEPFRAQALDEAIAALPAEANRAQRREKSSNEQASQNTADSPDRLSKSIPICAPRLKRCRRTWAPRAASWLRRRACACWRTTWNHRNPTCCSAAIRWASAIPWNPGFPACCRTRR